MIGNINQKNVQNVPEIIIPNKPEKNKPFDINVRIKENNNIKKTVKIHKGWIEIYFKPKNDEYPLKIGNFDFAAFGVNNYSELICKFKTSQPGKVIVHSYCNAFGLQKNFIDIDFN